MTVPAFAAESETTSQLKNEVVLQRRTGSETIKLPAGMSGAELSKLKNNIQKYGNQKLSQEEVSRINAKAAANGGLVYGSWFGGVSQYYAMSTDESVTFLAAMTSFCLLFVDGEGIVSVKAKDIAGGLTTAVSARYIIPAWVNQGQWVKATMAKKYREVKYSGGTFAYFQTGFWANNLKVANKSYGSPVTIFSGELD